MSRSTEGKAPTNPVGDVGTVATGGKPRWPTPVVNGAASAVGVGLPACAATGDQHENNPTPTASGGTL
eukprot:9112668-Lingulodinium_polyedra.AAC.1